MLDSSKKLAAPSRFLSIDILRGGTVAMMIVFNNPGDWDAMYSELRHATWNGWTVADLIFPNFLFLGGASIVLSIGARRFHGDDSSTLLLRLMTRSAKLIGLEILLTAFPRFRWRGLRVYGVLARTAIGSLIVGGLLLLTSSIPTLSAVSTAILIGYWTLLRFVPVPGLGRPALDFELLDPEKSLVAHVDRKVTRGLQNTLGVGSLYHGTHDPEGLLSTLPVVSTILNGAIAALWMRRHTCSATERRNRMLAAGLAMLLGGWGWSGSMPVNKNLWTPAFVLVSSGFSLLALSVLYATADVARLHKRAHVLRVLDWPWIVFGANAIVAFAVSVVLAKSMSLRLPDGSDSVSGLLYRRIFARKGSTRRTSLAYAVSFAAICFLPNLWLWRKRIFLKI